ncbi:MAG: hypothetical protein Q8S21_04090 [Candidatus Paracaedibacteraceae bacterium]|nr:hypothetical protein [Candidatus Paracaedibacteraceae bacterium]
MKQILCVKNILAALIVITTHCSATQYHNVLCDQHNNPITYTLADFKDTPYVHQYDAYEFHQAAKTQLSTTLDASLDATDQPTAFVFLMSTLIYSQLFHLTADQNVIQDNIHKAISILNSPIVDSEQWFKICGFKKLNPIQKKYFNNPQLAAQGHLNIDVAAPNNLQQNTIEPLMQIINRQELQQNAFANLWGGLYEALSNQRQTQGGIKPTDNNKLIYAASAYLLPAINALNYCYLHLTNDTALNAAQRNIALYTKATGPLTLGQTEIQKINLKELLIHPSLLHPLSWYSQPNTFPVINNVQKLFAVFTHKNNDKENIQYTHKSKSTLMQIIEQLKNQNAISKLTLARSPTSAILPALCNSAACYIAYETGAGGIGLYCGLVGATALGFVGPYIIDYLESLYYKPHALMLNKSTLNNEFQLIAILDTIDNNGIQRDEYQSGEIAREMISQYHFRSTENSSLIQTVVKNRG